MTKPDDRHYPWVFVVLPLTGLALGAALGALTTAYNATVSPTYYRHVLNWQFVRDIWRASVAEGIFEGMLYGLVFSLLFTVVVGIVSKGRCCFSRALRYVGAFGVASLASWLLGGLIAVGLASFSPEFYRARFRDVPQPHFDMLWYAWVGGSIWGIVYGGLALTIVASVMFYANWRRSERVELQFQYDPAVHGGPANPWWNRIPTSVGLLIIPLGVVLFLAMFRLLIRLGGS